MEGSKKNLRLHNKFDSQHPYSEIRPSENKRVLWEKTKGRTAEERAEMRRMAELAEMVEKYKNGQDSLPPIWDYLENRDQEKYEAE